MTRKAMVVAIDGPSGVGKTTVSARVAARLGYRYVNTGSMYRAVALAARDSWVDLSSDMMLGDFCKGMELVYEPETGRVSIDGTDYTDRLRSQEAGELASKVSAKRSVRECLVACQRALAVKGGVVMEGRDIGTDVFPEAEVKIFLDAPHEVRAKRRHMELVGKDSAEAGAGAVSREVEERDRRDRERQASPLRPAEGAILIDTASLSISEVVEKIVAAVNERLRVGDTDS